jgi:hypothetical protein
MHESVCVCMHTSCTCVCMFVVYMHMQAMTNPIALHPGLVKCDQIHIRASIKFSNKNTICVIRVLVTFWIPIIAG